MKDQIKHQSPHPDPYHGAYARLVFGFWLFLLTDFVLFGVLFACFAVLKNSTFQSLGAKDLFDIDYAIIQSICLLICSFLSGLMSASAHRKDTKKTIIFSSLLFVVGMVFFIYMLADFQRLLDMGGRWDKSAFLSAFYTLLATHALHVIFALLWIVVLIIPVLRFGIGQCELRRISCLRLFWQFLNIVWIFIFAIVYFMGRG